MAERGSFENPISINDMDPGQREEYERVMAALDDPRSVVLSTLQADGSVVAEVLFPAEE